jgi:hypothetical protein
LHPKHRAKSGIEVFLILRSYDSFAGSGLQPEPFVNVLVQSAGLNQP